MVIALGMYGPVMILAVPRWEVAGGLVGRREERVPSCGMQRWQQVIFCKSKSSHKSFPCKSKSSHKSFPCKSKSSHKSFGQTSSQVTSHLVQTQVKSQVFLSKYKSSRTLFCPAVIRNQGQASNQSTVSYSQRYMKWSMVFNNFYWCTNMEYYTCIHNEIVGGGDLFILFFKFCWQPSSKNTGDV